MVALRDEGKLIGYYEKHEYRNTEKMKLYDFEELWEHYQSKKYFWCIYRRDRLMNIEIQRK